jgi:hypothetical protein
MKVTQFLMSSPSIVSRVNERPSWNCDVSWLREWRHRSNPCISISLRDFQSLCSFVPIETNEVIAVIDLWDSDFDWRASWVYCLHPYDRNDRRAGISIRKRRSNWTKKRRQKISPEDKGANETDRALEVGVIRGSRTYATERASADQPICGAHRRETKRVSNVKGDMMTYHGTVWLKYETIIHFLKGLNVMEKYSPGRQVLLKVDSQRKPNKAKQSKSKQSKARSDCIRQFVCEVWLAMTVCNFWMNDQDDMNADRQDWSTQSSWHSWTNRR